MNAKIDALTKSIADLEAELEIEVARQNAGLRFTLENGKIAFDDETTRRHKEMRVGYIEYSYKQGFLSLLTSPLILVIALPLILLDVLVSIYHFVCFPIYGIAKVKRSDHFVFDRHLLSYLNLAEIFNCAYCSYATGLISYVREIAGRTEMYWCPIKHARRLVNAHSQYSKFFEYGDAEDYIENLYERRKSLGEDD